MEKKEYEILKAKFLSLIASVPLPLRKEIIAFIDNQTISWDAAYGEISQNTKNAESILKRLKEIGLL